MATFSEREIRVQITNALISEEDLKKIRDLIDINNYEISRLCLYHPLEIPEHFLFIVSRNALYMVPGGEESMKRWQEMYQKLSLSDRVL